MNNLISSTEANERWRLCIDRNIRRLTVHQDKLCDVIITAMQLDSCLIQSRSYIKMKDKSHIYRAGLKVTRGLPARKAGDRILQKTLLFTWII